MNHPLQNWQGECGRGPSLEHPVSGGYCVACERVKAADALAKAAHHHDCPNGFDRRYKNCLVCEALAAYEKVRGEK